MALAYSRVSSSLLRGGERLAEGGAVLEGEAGLRQRVPVAAPAFAPGALVALVHEDQVVALERLHRHGEAAAFLHLRELGDFDDAHRVRLRAGQQVALAQIEAAAGDAGEAHRRQVLFAQALVGRDQQDAVERLAVGRVVVVTQKLVVVEVQQQRLAAAGGDPERQLAQVVASVRQIHAHVAEPGIGAAEQLEAVELVQQLPRAAEEPVQVDFRVEDG